MAEFLISPLVAEFVERQLGQERAHQWDLYMREPTDEQKAAVAAREAERTEAKKRVEAAVIAVTEPALRAVLDLHRDTGYECYGCDSGEYGAQWPCPTIETVAPFIGITEADLKLI